MNKVVVRYADGRLIKGMTADFFPNKDIFHVSVVGSPPDAEPLEVSAKELKALFFVRTFEGDPEYNERKAFNPDRPPVGRQIKVVFRDGEVLVGTTTGYKPDRPGFFVVPADDNSNNERCFVITSAAQKVGFI